MNFEFKLQSEGILWDSWPLSGMFGIFMGSWGHNLIVIISLRILTFDINFVFNGTQTRAGGESWPRWPLTKVSDSHVIDDWSAVQTSFSDFHYSFLYLYFLWGYATRSTVSFKSPSWFELEIFCHFPLLFYLLHRSSFFFSLQKEIINILIAAIWRRIKVW